MPSLAAKIPLGRAISSVQAVQAVQLHAGRPALLVHTVGAAVALDAPTRFDTPGVRTIEDLATGYDAPADRQIKTLIYVLDGAVTLVLLRGDHALEEQKLIDATGARAVRPAEAEEIFAALGAHPGSLGSVAVAGLPIIADLALRDRSGLVTGANTDNVHLRGVDVARDINVGSWADLRAVAALNRSEPPGPPCLRKDFMVHPIQVLEARECGASAILVIVRALGDEEIRVLCGAAQAAGLEVLFEVHSEAEIDRAASHGARMIGVNNRDLSVFRTDLALSERLIPRFPKGAVAVSESGINTAGDAARARRAGARAVLVGEALMRSADPAALVASFRQA